jgi:predicted small secreted protein
LFVALRICEKLACKHIKGPIFNSKKPSSIDACFAKTGLTNFVQAKRRKTVAMAAFGHALGGKMKKKTLLLSALFLVVLALEGCATIRGMGDDIQSIGRAVKRTVSGG